MDMYAFTSGQISMCDYLYELYLLKGTDSVVEYLEEVTSNESWWVNGKT